MCLYTRLHIHGRTHTLTPSSALAHITRNSGNRRFLAPVPFLQPQKEPQEAQAHPTSPLVHQSGLQMLHGRNMQAFPVASSVPPDSNVGGPSVEASDTGAQGRVHGCALGFGVGMSRLWRSAIHCLYTATLAVRGVHFSSQNCIQAAIQSPRPLPHMNLNVSERLIWALRGMSRFTDRVTGKKNKTVRE